MQNLELSGLRGGGLPCEPLDSLGADSVTSAHLDHLNSCYFNFPRMLKDPCRNLSGIIIIVKITRWTVNQGWCEAHEKLFCENRENRICILSQQVFDLLVLLTSDLRGVELIIGNVSQRWQIGLNLPFNSSGLIEAAWSPGLNNNLKVHLSWVVKDAEFYEQRLLMDIAICSKYLSSRFRAHSPTSCVVTVIFTDREMDSVSSHTIPMRVISPFGNSKIK